MAISEKSKANLRPAKPGEVRNPKGINQYKPLTRALERESDRLFPLATLSDALRKQLGYKLGQKVTCAEFAARYIYIVGVRTGRGGIATVFREIADRLEGKAIQPVQVSGPDTKEITIKVLYDK